MMNKHRNEDSALTAVFGVLTITTTVIWAFIMTYAYLPMLTSQTLTLGISIFSSVMGFMSLTSICMWLYLMYPSIKQNEEKLIKNLDRPVPSKFLLDEDDKILLSAYIDDELTVQEKEYVKELLGDSEQARKYLQAIQLVDQKTREFLRPDCPYCGEDKKEGYHYKCWIR